jgi:peptidyl-prolyl cis-trans isomerase A (cyclophilin A)
MKTRFLLAFVAGYAMAQPAAQTPAAQTPPAKPQAAATEAPKPPREPGLYATIITSMGNIVVKLYDKESPVTVKNFTDLSTGRKEWIDPKTMQPTRRPLYSGLIFHRVIPGFMIQGGDPLGNGTGDGGMKPIIDEFHPSLKFDIPGRLAMANSGPATGTCQFFITEVPTPHLTGKHTIFGQVVEGQDLVGQIARVPRDSNDKPRTPVTVKRIAIQKEPPDPPAVKKAPAAKKKAPTAAPATGTPAAPKTSAAPKTTAPKTTTPPATKK